MRALNCRAPIPLLAFVLLAVLTGPARADVRQGLGYFQSGQFAEAFDSWQEAADGGDAQAALYVGVLFDTGLGVPQDFAEALRWYRMAANGGNVTAMFNVAVMYDAGRGNPPDPQAAAEWYGRAAAKGFGRADYNLALLGESEPDLQQDRRHTIALYRAAASQGVTAALGHLRALGQPYGGPVQRKEDPAMAEFQRAERVLLARGTGQAAAAVALFRKAAEDGNALAEYDLGYCYEHGIGVQALLTEAYDWYRRAAGDARDPAVRSIAEAGARNLQAQVSQTAR